MSKEKSLENQGLKLRENIYLSWGVPQAVEAYMKSKSFEDTDRIKRRILKLYREDITKFAKGYEAKVLAVFDEMPSQLSKTEKKYKLSNIDKGARFREYENAFLWLTGKSKCQIKYLY